MTGSAPDGVQSAGEGRWYHTNCGGEVSQAEVEYGCEQAECGKCGARWVRGPWKLSRMGKMTWDLPALEKKR